MHLLGAAHHGRLFSGRLSGAGGVDRPGKIILGMSAWGVWGSCGDPGRGRVQICHKGAPGRDRPRRKARNINDSLPAFRLDRGLCGRFGQLAPPRALWGGRLSASARSMASALARAPARRAGADRAGAPFDRTGPARATPRTPHRRPDPRDRHLTHENVPLADVLAGYPAISRVTRRSRGPPRRSPTAPHHRPLNNLPGSAAKKSAEYQRFFSRASARSGSLWQIWTTRRRGPAGEGVVARPPLPSTPAPIRSTLHQRP